jgi:hypothetical protein
MLRKLVHLNLVTNDPEVIIGCYVNKLAWTANPDGDAIELLDYGSARRKLTGQMIHVHTEPTI